jgi:hypothetical protein
MESIVSQFAGIYREWAPHASLRGHVRCLWMNDLSTSRSECVQVVPDGCVDIADSGGGIARVEFTARNSFGVVDHTVIRPSGQRVYVPMRLIANGSGCELLFTLFRESDMSDARFGSDAGFVERDLNGLKRLLEK